MKRVMAVAALVATLVLVGCSGDRGPSKEYAVKAVEAYFTQQGREATLQRTWQFDVTDAEDMSLKCEKKPNGDQECAVTGRVMAQGKLGGQPTTPEGRPMNLKLHVVFRPQGEGWQPVQVRDEGTSAG
ncbi:hypothetical protein [Xanthomonas graminis]|uniref:hypothetical protein n=1 Tax=Xanthomonas graminis TaxID=3390026 RepID=UPI0020C7CE99|nr:hypothetical protein [Xanthomonas translucens]